MGIFGILIAGIVLIGSLAGFVAMERKAGGDAVRAKLQPKLEACEGAVKAQNDALAALKAAGDAKAARAAQALAGATQKARVWEDNAARLRAVLTAPRKAGEAAPTSCNAAWKEIRGLSSE